MMFNSSLLLCTGIVILCIVEAQGIKCFQCNSYKDSGCADLTKTDTNSTFYHECPENHVDQTSFCRKTKFTVLDNANLTRIIRGCGWIRQKTNATQCFNADTDFKHEITCQCFLDGCNSALSRFSNFIYLLLAVTIGITVFN